MITEQTGTAINTPNQEVRPLPAENNESSDIARWLLPVQELESVSSEFFGRNVQANIQRLENNHRPLGIKLRDKLAVIIIDSASYEELLTMKAAYLRLIERIKQSDDAQGRDL